MPDPGVAPTPNWTEGEQELHLMQAAGMSVTDMQRAQAEEEQMQRAARMPQADIDRYWGRTQTPSPTVQNAVGANLHRAIQQPAPPDAKPTGIIGTLAAALNVHLPDYTAAVHEQQQQAQAQRVDANLQFYKGVDDTQESFLDRARDVGMGFAGAVSGSLSYMAAPLTGGLNAAAGPGVDAALTSYTKFSNDNDWMRSSFNAQTGRWDVQPKIPELTAEQHQFQRDLPGNFATIMSGFAGGGAAAEGVAGTASAARNAATVMPEATRYLAIDAMRKGEIRNPGEVLMHAANPEQITPGMVAGVPRAIDFETAARRLLPKGETDAVLRVVSNLQDMWAKTGTDVGTMVKRALSDGTFREELVSQTVDGKPVTPVTGAMAPKPPRPFVQRPTAEPGIPTLPPARGAPQPATFVNSPEESLGMMGSLEGSPDIGGRPQISRTGAVGKYQIEPPTARQYMPELRGLNDAQVRERLSDPAYNRAVAGTIVTDLYRRYHGNMEAMAIAYNDGPGRANEWVNAGPGSRLEAIRDNTQKSGWRYTQVASQRDEMFMPRETQEYVARARFKMGNPEAELPRTGEFTPAPHAEVPSDVAARVAADDEARQAAEAQADIEREHIRSGSLSAASVWDEAPVENAYDEIASNIGEQHAPEPVHGLSMWDRAINAIASRLQPAKAVDDLAKDAIGIDPEKEFSVLDAFRQAAHSDDRAGLAMGFIHGKTEMGGVIERDGDVRVRVVPGTATAREAIQTAIRNGGDPETFMRWLSARRALALESGGVKTPFNLMAAQRIMNDAGETAKYSEAAAKWDQFTAGVRRYAQSSGRFSQAQIDAMERTDLSSWVSFRSEAGLPQVANKRGFTVGSPVKAIKGRSQGMVGDVLANSLDNVRLMFQSADRNFAIGKLVRLAEENPEFAQKLGLVKSAIPDAPDLNAVEKQLKAYGIPEDQWEASYDAMSAVMQERSDLRPNEFAYFRDGKKEIWQTAWPELADMIKGAPAVQANAVVKLFQGIAHVVQGTVVALPDFAVKMFGGHQMFQWITDPLHPPPVFTGLDGMIHQFGMHDMLQEVMANGGLGSAMQQLDRDFQYDTMTQVLGETGWLDRARNDISQFKQAPSLGGAVKAGVTSVLSPVRLLRGITERLDMANRVGLTRRALAAGMDPLKAGAHAAEYGIDYTNAAANSVVNMWASMVPFMRAGLLYQEQAVKAIERNPAAYTGMATVAVTMPKMALFALNMMADDIPKGMPGYVPEEDKYRNLPEWERLYYYITPPIAGQRMKLRMPDFAAFPFGAVPEMVMQTMYMHDPVQFKDAFTTWLHDYVPPVTPAAIKPPMETVFNTNMETWQPLVPSSLSGAVGELQYTDATSQVSRKVANILGPPMRSIGLDTPSPIALDHLVKGYLNQPGADLLSALGAPENPPGAPQDVARLPMVNSFFVAHPGWGNALNEFYAEKDQFDKWAESKQVLRKDVRGGDTSEMNLAPEAVMYARAQSRLNEVSASFSRMRAVLHGIDANATLSDDQKRQYTSQVLEQEIPAMRAWTQTMRNALQHGPRAIAPDQPEEQSSQGGWQF